MCTSTTGTRLGGEDLYPGRKIIASQVRGTNSVEAADAEKKISLKTLWKIRIRGLSGRAKRRKAFFTKEGKGRQLPKECCWVLITDQDPGRGENVSMAKRGGRRWEGGGKRKNQERGPEREGGGSD